MSLESQTVNLKTLIAVIAVTWTAGTGVAVWAANQEMRVSELEETQEDTKAERRALKDSTDDLADVVRDLNVTLKLMEQRLELERAYETVAEEPE